MTPLKSISYHYISHLLISSYHCRVIVLVTKVALLNLLPTLNKVLFYSILTQDEDNPPHHTICYMYDKLRNESFLNLIGINNIQSSTSGITKNSNTGLNFRNASK